MSPSDQIQDLFDRALSSVPDQAAPSPQTIHQRLSRRRVVTRLSTFGGGALTAAVVVSSLVIGLSSNPSFAVTLYPNSNEYVTFNQLHADQKVMIVRLRSVGYPHATIKVSNGALVVTNGPRSLSNPSSYLTSSPELLIRSVTCYAGLQSGPLSSGLLPSTCSSPRYAAPTAPPVNPAGGGTSSGSPILTSPPDPVLAAFATTTPAQDAASPDSSALLPVLSANGSTTQRYLVGPTLETLSSKVASASVAHVKFSGWIVTIRLNQHEARIWNQVASEYFHRQLAVDLNGVIVTAPLIEPMNPSFSSFDGEMQLYAPSSNDAYDLAAALTSGPLAVPLETKTHAATTDAKSAAPSRPACLASNITVTAGATVTNTTYTVKTSTGLHQASAYEKVPVYFYNRSATCHLLMGAPEVRAVRDTAHGAAITLHDLSIPTGSDNTRRPVVAHHQKLEALFVVVKPVGSPFTGCDPMTTTGFLVGDYAKPIATTHFVVRRLHDVCFDSGVGRNVLDYGIGFPPA